MEKKQIERLIEEHESKGLSYRILARKYGVSLGYISKVIKSDKEHRQKQIDPPVAKKKVRPIQDDLPDDVSLLKEEIRKLRLKIELQDIIIDISSKETGIDLRKKRGARRSK